MALWSAAARRAAVALRCSSGKLVKVLRWTGNARASSTVAPEMAATAAPVSLGEVIRDMKHEVHLRGRVLFGRLSIEAELMEGIVVSVLEDGSEAGCCCYLFICNFASSWWTAEQARMWFPKHARVSIEDPKISVGGDGVPCVELINPAALQILGLDLKMEEDSADAEKMLAMADAAMQRRDFIRAALLYSSCMQKSKASEAWLGAELYDRALESASASDEPQSSVENLIRKARALIGVHQYTSALQCLQTAQVKEDDSLMKRCRRLVEHSQGRFDLEDYYLSRESRECTPECGDYIGPVRIGMAGDGQGRGLFATREIKAGEVILCCNPLAAMFDNQKLPDEEDLRAAMIRNCIASNRSLQQLVALVDSEDIPDLALFTPNSKFEQKSLGLVDVPVCAARTSVNYGYKFERVIGMDRKPEYLSGLWVMTAFANHSCAPSATQKAVGNACMMRAARDLLPGEEITLPYLDPLAPWEIRSRQTKSRWGFDCACERCKFEQQLGAPFQGLGSKTEKLLDGSSNLDLFELSEIAIKVEKTISKWDNERHKHWMRASYYKAYEVYLLNRDEFERFIVRKAPPSWETIMEALRFTAPGYEGLLTLLTVFAKHAGDSSSRAKEMLVQECVSCFGELSASTLASIIQRECNELDGMLTLKTT